MIENASQLWHGVLFRQRPDLSLESISPHVQEWTGLDPQLTPNAIHPADRDKVNTDCATFRLRHARTWQIVWVEQRRRPLPAGGFEGYWENITPRMHLNQELAQAHWKATFGAATQRLIHDFNNLLTGVLSLSDAYLLRLDAANPAREGLQLINQNARQAADIVHQIGTLAREKPGRRSYQDLAQLAAGAADMLRRILPKYSVLKVECRQQSIPVYLDPAELKQMIIALGLALTPPITLEVALENAEARLTISGEPGDNTRALVLAESFAGRNDADLACSVGCPQPTTQPTNQPTAQLAAYTFRFPEANFTEDERRARSILLVASETPDSLRVADLLRQNGYEAVVGPATLKGSADYRFDATVAFSHDADGSLSREADVMLRKEMDDREILAALRDEFQP